MKLVFRPEARREALEARAWYDRRSPDLGSDFARAVDAAIAMVQRMPEAFSPIEDDCRRVLLRRFPYAVIFRLRQSELLIVAVFHHRRDASIWKGRNSP